MKIQKLITIIFSMAVVSLSGQETQEGLDYTGEVSKMVPLPVSPEAAAFMTYGNTPVNLYTGTPDINIPLYTFQGREMALPMSLSYDAGGIRVEQQATWVGLGWNLNVGGRITRIANGLPDDFFTGDIGGLSGTSHYNTLFTADAAQLDLWLGFKNLGYSGEFNTTAQVSQYFDFLKDINDNKIDVQPDYFSINVPGLSDYIVIDYDSGIPTAVALKNPRVSVSYVTAHNEGIAGWTVTNEDGTVYHFDANAREYTYQQIDESANDTPKNRRYTSSWMLTKIESPNKKDIYELGYTPSGFWLQPFPAALVGHITNTLDGNASGTDYGETVGSYTTTSSTTQINQQFLNSIEHNNKMIISMSLNNRSDLALNTNSALDEILIHKYGAFADYMKRIKLRHGYFGDPASSQPVMDWRLKLDGIDIKGGDQTTYETYSFDYEQAEDLPSKNSKSQDYLGFYNGKGNTVLYPEYAAGIDNYGGADLSPDVDFAKIGLLTKMTYPTGGYTEFVYEGDTTSESSSSSTGSSVIERTYATASLIGGNVDDNPYCFAYCNDKYQGNPAYRKSNFTVPEDGYYTIAYTKSGGGTAEAIIYRDSPFIDYEIAAQEIIPHVWASNGSSDIASKFFEAGRTYAIFLVNGGQGSSSSLRIYREETIITGGGNSSQNNLRAGLRIASIRDHTNQGELAKHRDYVYAQGINSAVSSGRVIYQPLLAYVSRISDGTDILHRVAGGSGGQQPHVVYERVYEVVKDINDPGLSAPIGYTRYEFYTGSDGIITAGAPPFFNNFVSKYEVGKEKSVTVYDTDNQAVDLTENTYADFGYFATTGMALMLDSEFQQSYVHIYKDIDNKFRYRRVEPELQNFNGSSVVSGPPQICYQPDNSCLFNTEFATYTQRVTGASGRYGAPVSVRTTRYLESGDVVGETQMTYSDGNGVERHILKERSTVDSRGDTLRTKYFYPEDNVAQGSGFLTNKNRLTEVVKTESYRNGGLLYSREQEYVENGDAVLPKVIKSLKGDNGPGMAEQRILLEYDARDNLRESAIIVADDPQAGQDYATGPGTVYIWGYNDLYPVAKVENATTAQVAALSGFNGDLDISPSLSLTTEQEDTLRSLPNTMVTTYTYDPLVGVTSITDPKGYSTYFEYDEFQRLVAQKDSDEYMEKEYFYRYGNEVAITSDLSVTDINTPDLVFSGENSTFSIEVTRGTGNYSYAWTFVAPDGTSVNATGAFVSLNLGNSFEGLTQISCLVRDLGSGSEITAYKQVTVYREMVPGAVISAYDWAEVNDVAGTFTVSPQYGSGDFEYTWRFLIVGGGEPEPTVVGSTINKSFGPQYANKDVLLQCTIEDQITGQTELIEKTISVYEALTLGNIAPTLTYVAHGEPNSFQVLGGSGGSGSFLYDWEFDAVNGDININNTTSSVSPDLTASQLGQMTIRVTMKDTNTTKTEQRTMVVTVLDPLTAGTISAPSTVLVGTQGNFSILSSGGTGNYRYNWSINKNGGGSAFYETTSPQLNVLLNNDFYGDSRVFCTVTDTVTGWTKSASSVPFIVNGYDPLEILSIAQFNPDTSNAGVIVYNAFVTVDKGSGDYTFVWNTSKGTVSNNSPFYNGFFLNCYQSGWVECTVNDNVTGESRTSSRLNLSFSDPAYCNPNGDQ